MIVGFLVKMDEEKKVGKKKIVLGPHFTPPPLLPLPPPAPHSP
jgi:hypothetical protein